MGGFGGLELGGAGAAAAGSALAAGCVDEAARLAACRAEDLVILGDMSDWFLGGMPTEERKARKRR